jgi:hypothetical protein
LAELGISQYNGERKSYERESVEEWRKKEMVAHAPVDSRDYDRKVVDQFEVDL